MLVQPIGDCLYNHMNNILDNSKLFSNICYLKKSMLMFENIHGKLFMVTHKDIMDNIKQALDNIKSISELNLLTQNLVCFIKDYCIDAIGIKKFDKWQYGNYEQFTDKYHHRKFWNEIENHEIIDEFIQTFCRLWNNENHKIYTDSNYDESICTWNVRLYNFNNFDLYFENQEETDAFTENFELEPITVSAKNPNENIWTKVYSI